MRSHAEVRDIDAALAPPRACRGGRHAGSGRGERARAFRRGAGSHRDHPHKADGDARGVRRCRCGRSPASRSCSSASARDRGARAFDPERIASRISRHGRCREPGRTGHRQVDTGEAGAGAQALKGKSSTCGSEESSSTAAEDGGVGALCWTNAGAMAGRAPVGGPGDRDLRRQSPSSIP